MKRFNPLNSALLRALRICGIRKTALVLSALAFVAPVTLLAGKPNPPPSYPYTLRQLNPPSGATSASANGMNEFGRIVGTASFQNNDSAGCIWESDGRIVVLPVLATAQIRGGNASVISDTGLISGYCVTSRTSSIYNENLHAAFWENTSGSYEARDWNGLMLHDIGVHLYGSSKLSADGQFVAFSGKDRLTGEYATVIAGIQYYPNQGVSGLEILDVIPGTLPGGISHDGAGVLRVVGSKPGLEGAFLWKSVGGVVEMNLSQDGDRIQATGVNKYGQVSAIRRPNQSASAALIWYESDLWNLNASRDLGTFGGTVAAALGINDLGQVVGRASTGGRTSQDRAFIFHNDTTYDLNLLAPVGKLVLEAGIRINNAGQTLVVARTNGGSLVTVLLTPIAP